jgi:hypothetical protein
MPKLNRTLRHAGVYTSVALAIGIVSYRSSGSIPTSVAARLLGSLVGTYGLLRLDGKANKRLASLGLPDGDHPARIHATAFVKGSPDEVLIACEKALRCLPNFGELTRRVDGTLVQARTRRSMQSWGERITVQVRPAESGSSLQVSSVPILWTVTEDMRINFQNVALVMREISRTFALSDVQPAELLNQVLAK